MAIVVTLAYDQNTRARGPQGDLTTAIYNVAVAAGGNLYPAGGEPIDFSAQFAEVHSAFCDPGFGPPVEGAADVVGVQLGKFQAAAATTNTGFIRFYDTGGGPGGPLTELAVGAYPNAMVFTIVVHGRPATDGA